MGKKKDIMTMTDSRSTAAELTSVGARIGSKTKAVSGAVSPEQLKAVKRNRSTALELTSDGTGTGSLTKGLSGANGSERLEAVKRERLSISSELFSNGAGIGSKTKGVGRAVFPERLQAVKREQLSRNRGQKKPYSPCRSLRSRYLAIKNLINDERDDLLRIDSEKFATTLTEVKNLYELVEKPSEQVADAEALLDIASTLVSSAKSYVNGGITPSDFVDSLRKDFGQPISRSGRVPFNWKDLGQRVSPIFRNFPGCCTMFGPMDRQLKQRKVTVHRRRTRPTENARPEEIDDDGAEEKTDTDKNMSTMFEILKRKKRVGLDILILNRQSFSQTVENLFALSFLVKDGRAEVIVDEEGNHFVSPKNAPASSLVLSGEVAYSQFVFRFDHRVWKMMISTLPHGEELMPHRGQQICSAS